MGNSSANFGLEAFWGGFGQMRVLSPKLAPHKVAMAALSRNFLSTKALARMLSVDAKSVTFKRFGNPTSVLRYGPHAAAIRA